MSLSCVSGRVIGAAIEVHKNLGPGLLESAYESCLIKELELQGMHVERQRPLRLSYKGIELPCCYRLDLIVEDSVIIEIKTGQHFSPIHEAQLLSYLKLAQCKVGLLLNFHVKTLKAGGIRRITLD